MKRGWYRICYTLCNFIIALFVLPCYIGTLLSACGILVIFAEPSSATPKDLWWPLSLGVISVAFFIIMYIANKVKYYINACYICELLFDVTNTEVSPKSFTAEIHKSGKKFRWNSKLPKQEDLNCFFSALTTMYKDYGSERWYDVYREITDYDFSKRVGLYPQILQFEEQLQNEHGSLWKIYFDKCMNTNFGEVTRKYSATIKAQEEIDLKKSKLEICMQREFEMISKRMEDDTRKLLESPKAIPFIADVVADYKTAGIEYIAQSLGYDFNTARFEKAAKIREIRRETQTLLKTYEVSHYQLKYILDLYPALEDLIDLEYSEVPVLNLESIENDYDRTREWLSKEEYNSLPVTERNQLSLDRYVESHRKNKWQIGRDYELYMGHMYSIAGYSVDTFGSYMGVEDLGRDLILKKKGETDIIVQCKYWSKQKEIHENHVMQLYGTTVAYKIEHYIGDKVRGYLVTNTVLSETAKKYADYLGLKYFENVEIGEYPRIKCNIGKYGEKIYHLPFDQQYDNVKICKPGECYATTVKEAEDKGFRRAFKWHGEK